MKKKNVILVSSGWFHPPLSGRWFLKHLIHLQPEINLVTVNSLASAAELGFGEFDAVIVYVHKKEISINVLNQLRDYVNAGGGLVGIHSATASYQQEEAWFELIGGRFESHGPIEAIHYQRSAAGEFEFPDTPDFWVDDELYRHTLQAGIQPVYEADFQGEKQPMVWQYTFGAGRVFYACPGHKPAVFKNPVYRQVLLHGLGWVCAS